MQVAHNILLPDLHGRAAGREVFFHDSYFHALSNTAAFSMRWKGMTLPTAEHAYQWERFAGHAKATNLNGPMADQIARAPSAYEAMDLGRSFAAYQRPDWAEVRESVLRSILREKVKQHPYVRKLLQTSGDCALFGDSERDVRTGEGPSTAGVDMLAKLWTEIRSEVRTDVLLARLLGEPNARA